MIKDFNRYKKYLTNTQIVTIRKIIRKINSKDAYKDEKVYGFEVDIKGKDKDRIVIYVAGDALYYLIDKKGNARYLFGL